MVYKLTNKKRLIKIRRIALDQTVNQKKRIRKDQGAETNIKNDLLD